MYLLNPQKVLHLKNELKKKNPKLYGEYLITEKFNGWFVYIYYNSKTHQWSSPYSSANRQIPSLAWSYTIFNKLPKPKTDHILIAEAVLEDTPFHILNGIFNRSIGDCSCYDVTFKCHDLIDLENNKLARDRFIDVGELLAYNDNEYLQKPELLLVSQYDDKLWKYQFDKIIDENGEGIVAKRAEAFYSFGKRNSDLLKLKMETAIDALAVRLEETVGEKGNNSLTLVSQRKNGIFIRTVINNKQLQEIFLRTPKTIIGKVVELKGMDKLPNGQLVQPVFSCIRDDKKVTDYE